MRETSKLLKLRPKLSNFSAHVSVVITSETKRGRADNTWGRPD